MKIVPCGSVPTTQAPSSHFTGRVMHQALVLREAPARLAASLVAFEPRARTFWHTHPCGQTLYVVSGAGRAQSWGGPVREIRAGDVVVFEPGEKHWHGGGPTTAMTHVAMQEHLDGVSATWLEEVADEAFDTPAAG